MKKLNEDLYLAAVVLFAVTTPAKRERAEEKLRQATARVSAAKRKEAK